MNLERVFAAPGVMISKINLNFFANRCENLMTCPMKEIGSGAEHCPYDWLAIHDGRDEYAPIIGQFCGMGKFPFSIIGNFNFRSDFSVNY